MSDAPQPPQLRLKPRLKTEPEAVQPSAPAPVPPPVQSAEEKQAAAAPIAFKLRAATPPPTADLPPSPPAPTPVAPPAPAPASVIVPAAAPAEPAPDTPSKLRLRSKEIDPAASPSTSPVSPPADAGDAAAAAAEPVAPKGLKLTAKVPQTLHPHPEGVPPAFLTEVPAAPEPAAGVALPTPGLVMDNAPAPAPVPVPAPVPEPPQVSEPAPSAPSSNAAKKPPVSVKPTLTAPPVAPKPKVPHFKPSERLNMPAPAIPEAAPAGVKALKVGVLLVVVLIVLLLSAGGYFVWQYLNTPEPPPPAPRQHTAAPVAKPADPTDVAAPSKQPAADHSQAKPDDNIAHLPSKLINKAQDSIAARRSIEQERADNLLDGRDLPSDRGFPLNAPPQAPATPARDPAAPTVQPNTGTGYSNIAPGVVATDSSIRTTGKPSIAFRRIVSDFVIRGVYQGSPARAHINGRIVTAGNMVDKELQVTFVGVDSEDKMLIFRDAAGATVMRRY